MEAKGAMASALGRKCVVVRWADMQIESLMELVQRGAGSLLLLLPRNFTDVHGEMAEVLTSLSLLPSLTQSLPSSLHLSLPPSQQWRELERSIMNLKLSIPIYFSIEEETLTHIHNSLSFTAQRERESTVTASE